MVQVMKKENIYSAPVVDNSGLPVGLVDLADIAAYLTKLCCDAAGVVSGKGRETFEAFRKADMSKAQLAAIKPLFFETPVSKIINYSKRNQMMTINIEASSWRDLLNILNTKGVSRVVGVNGKGEAVKMLSQSSVITFIAQAVDKFPVNQLTIKSLNLNKHQPAIVTSTSRSIDCFVLMIEERLSSLGFVGDAAGNVSIKDIHAVANEFEHLVFPISDYISSLRLESVKDIVPFINVSENDLLGKVVQKIAAVGIHRVYIFGDDHGKVDAVPKGVIVLEDILRRFL